MHGRVRVDFTPREEISAREGRDGPETPWGSRLLLEPQGRLQRRTPIHLFECEQWVPATPERTFAFFSDAGNLEAITPPFLNFAIITARPIQMREGTLIAYRLRLFGAPVRWVSRIEEWAPIRSFTDVQVRGPYAYWRHVHRFEPRDGGTLILDRVDYRIPLEPLSTPVHALFVRPTIERIFAHRRRIIERQLS